MACYKNKSDVFKLLLRTRGISLNPCKKGGFSPLHKASGGGHAEAASVLLAAGSNVHLKSDEGYTSLDAAIHHNPPAIIALLQDHIAKQEGAEATVKVEVGAVLSELVLKVEMEVGAEDK